MKTLYFLQHLIYPHFEFHKKSETFGNEEPSLIPM